MILFSMYIIDVSKSSLYWQCSGSTEQLWLIIYLMCVKYESRYLFLLICILEKPFLQVLICQAQRGGFLLRSYKKVHLYIWVVMKLQVPIIMQCQRELSFCCLIDSIWSYTCLVFSNIQLYCLQHSWCIQLFIQSLNSTQIFSFMLYVR